MNGPADLLSQFQELITPDDIAMAQPMLETVNYEKNDVLLYKGDVCSDIHFIISGMAMNATVENEVEKVVHVSFSYEFCTALYSFYSRTPSEVNITALTPITAVKISYKNLSRLYDASKNWERVGRVFAERAFIKLMRHKYDIQHKRAFDRYHELVDRKPEILQLLSLGQIADILGISQETLSRIRSKR